MSSPDLLAARRGKEVGGKKGKDVLPQFFKKSRRLLALTVCFCALGHEAKSLTSFDGEGIKP